MSGFYNCRDEMGHDMTDSYGGFLALGSYYSHICVHIVHKCDMKLDLRRT
jgi:hypothetical protein